MKQESILIDMDHVMANITAQYIRYYEKATGILMDRNNLIGKPEDLAFEKPELIRGFLYTPGFFRTAPVIEGSIEVIKALNQKYNVFIVSAAMEFPQSLTEKYEWLQEHFPFIKWQQMIFCGSKKPITADYMIDDLERNLDAFPGKKLLFTATHNTLVSNGAYSRMDSWSTVKDLLLPEENKQNVRAVVYDRA